MPEEQEGKWVKRKPYWAQRVEIIFETMERYESVYNDPNNFGQLERVVHQKAFDELAEGRKKLDDLANNLLGPKDLD